MEIPSVCLSYLALGGIFLLGGALGYVVATVFSRNPKSVFGPYTITNAEALQMIHNYQNDPGHGPTDSDSGHIPLDVLMGYIDDMTTKCKAINKEISGLEYYFAKYGESASQGNTGKDTIVIYPTHQDASGNHIPIDPVGNETVSNMYGMFKTGALTSALSTSTNVLNRTHMSPPRMPSTL